MSAVTGPTSTISPEEYLEGELASEMRHEYVEGYVYAMAGASDDHNRIAGNTFAELHATLRGSPCEAFASDMKVKIPTAFADAFYYPDVTVTCDPDDNARYYRERPSIIFEVISPDTERTDRREKAIAYRQFSTIQAYILVEQERMAATILHRAEEGWGSESVEGREAVLKIPKLNVEIPFARIYERTRLSTDRGSVTRSTVRNPEPST